MMKMMIAGFRRDRQDLQSIFHSTHTYNKDDKNFGL